MPRERTLVVTPWGDRARDPEPENYNIYLSGSYNHQRESGDKTIYEALMYTNLNTGEVIPWQAESFTYNDSYTADHGEAAPGCDLVRRAGVQLGGRQVHAGDAARQRA